jgi:hypothetical protein
MNPDIKISKNFSVEDWKLIRLELLTSNEKWIEAIQVFEDRINSRFLSPIDKIQSLNKNEGEGFSIALISVVLLEFIAAFELGKVYKVYSKEGEIIAPHQYKSTISLLKEFLETNHIFKPHFTNPENVYNFYTNIRCGLVHEARTLGNDVIISSQSFKNTKKDSIYFKQNDEWRLNRDLLLATINEFVQNYKARLLGNEFDLRNRFIIKMDEIAGIKHVWYFIYGSNMFEEQLTCRLTEIGEKYLQKVRCRLKDYVFVYNKLGYDGSSKGNLLKSVNESVEGIAILVMGNKLDDFIKKFEPGYIKEKIIIETVNTASTNSLYTFKAYTCISYKTTTSHPTKEYVQKVIDGAKENQLPIEYIQNKLDYKPML